MNARLAIASLLAALSFAAGTASAAYPERPVKIVVVFSPGTTSDIVARLVGAKLAERWGQSVVIENREGAGGVVGADVVARSAPDGYTLMVTSNSFTLGKTLRTSLPYDPFRDFFAVTQITKIPNVVLVGKGLGVSNAKEFIALAKSGKLQYASSGRGTPSQLSVELFKALAGFQMEEIPYKSSTQALTDTISGQVALNAPGLSQGLPHVRGGKVVALGITGSVRAPGAPDIPTLAEAGVPGYEAYGWHGLFGPAKVPADIQAFLHKEMMEALKAPDLREKLVAQGAEVVGSTPQAFLAYLREDSDKWDKLMKQIGVKPE